MGSIYGKNLKISLFGESHGGGVGVVIDNFPAGIAVDLEEIERQLKRRAPGSEAYSTKRKEADCFEILSGVYQGKTTGTPICALTRNKDTRSQDYAAVQMLPRPSHGDYTGALRYHGQNDPRGGGHFSGRLTAPLVFAGALASLYLKSLGVTICAHLKSVGDICDRPFPMELAAEEAAGLRASRFPVLDDAAGKQMQELISDCAKDGDSVGGVIECMVMGMSAGVGSPIFDNCESRFASALFGVPGVKGVEFGAGFAISAMRGSQANDAFLSENKTIKTQTNHSGGLQGGITNGMPIVLSVAMKPTPSISVPQQTVDLQTGKPEELSIKGRHDSCIAVRAIPVVESAIALAAADLLLEANGYA